MVLFYNVFFPVFFIVAQVQPPPQPTWDLATQVHWFHERHLGIPVGFGVVFAVILAGYAVKALDTTSRPPAEAEDPAAGTPAAHPTLAPRSVTVCQVVLAIVMAYAIFAKLV